ncbi:MAG: serine/threonine protein kinase with repeat [Verrucomicrobiales bacterium]|nr:serine/threonine protein kinase with repeat [Verrucomicrobiales bacterium]
MPHSGQNHSKESAELVNGPSAPLVPDHEVLRVIGRGAYGQVWLARHRRLGTLRAVKVVRRDEFGDDRPFRREFEGIQKYEPLSRSHPNLVSILHVGGVGNAFYYVMELADSTLVAADVRRLISLPQGEPTVKTSESPDVDYVPKTLRAELKQYGLLPIERCLEIGRALASALAYLHQHGLVHRDVKPSNVIFVGGVAKLADIGLVAGVDDSRSFVGTEGYIPPEGPGKPSADCYSLGKLLYELSTGHDRNAWPEPATNLATRPDRERLLELNAILHRACSPDPRQRYPGAGAMLHDFELLHAGASVKRRHSLARNLSLAWKSAAIICVLAAALILIRNERKKAAMLVGQIAIPSKSGGSTNKAASQALQRGFQMANNFTALGFSNAVQEIERSVSLDPNFSHGWCILAMTLVLQVDYGYLPSSNALTRAKICAEKAIALNPQNGFAYCALAECMLPRDYDFANAERLFRKGIELDPANGTSRLNFARILVCQSRFTEATALLNQLTRDNPADSLPYKVSGFISGATGHFREAISSFDEAIRLSPAQPFHYGHRADVLFALNDRSAAARDLLRFVELGGFAALHPQSDAAALRRALEEHGSEEFVRQHLAILEAQSKQGQFVSAYDFARLHAHAGNRERSLDYLEKAVDEHRVLTLGVDINPLFKDFQDEPRYHGVLQRLKLEK